MSIIYDALKKIEKGVNNAPSSGRENRAKEVKIKKRPNPALIYILIILAGIFAVKTSLALFARPRTEPAHPIIPQVAVQTDITPALDTPPETALPEEEPAPESNPDPELILNGAYFQRGEGYALINNRIVKAGDTIRGATVKEIGLEKVTLEFEGRIITLISSPQ